MTNKQAVAFVSGRIAADLLLDTIYVPYYGNVFTAINNDNLQLKIRLYGIDAPEKKQAFGKKSKEYLSYLIFSKTISIDVKSQDSWGRYIAYAFTPEGRDVSYLMIEAGMAWHFVKYDNSPIYELAEANARKARRELWIDTNPVAPWDYRLDNR